MNKAWVYLLFLTLILAAHYAWGKIEEERKRIEEKSLGDGFDSMAKGMHKEALDHFIVAIRLNWKLITFVYCIEAALQMGDYLEAFRAVEEVKSGFRYELEENLEDKEKFDETRKKIHKHFLETVKRINAKDNRPEVLIKEEIMRRGWHV